MIRPARREDIDALLAIQAAWPGLPRWTRGHFEEELTGASRCLLVWDEGGAVLGYGAVRWVAPEAEIMAVAVFPERLRRGIGRGLLEALHAAAREDGCSIAGLEVSATNEAAQRLYASAGYDVVGRRAKYYNDLSDAVLMSRRLA